jgi:hypothetical protein
VGSGVRHVSIVDLAARVAELRSIELDLFERMSAAALAVDDPSMTPVLATWAHRHAWHAQLWADRFPSIPAVALSRPVGRSSDADVTRVLGDLIAGCEALRVDVDDVLDPPTVRVCDLVLADLRAELEHLAPEP